MSPKSTPTSRDADNASTSYEGQGTGPCCSSGWYNWKSALHIIIAVVLLIGAYAWGVWNGAGHSRYDRGDHAEYRSEKSKNMMENTDIRTDDAMNEHCQMMPNMAGCEKYLSGNTSHTGAHDMMDMSMTDMSRMLEGKTGDDLNKAFLEAMIPHHQGAIQMAKYLAGSDKPELIKLGGDIITAQTIEIEQMQDWLKEWGYAK